ncbi:tRNA adenosine deaminase-associated protein [Streptomyces laurentii]|uniref:tRNA adenosine deaminase-associated protein n=1 Tax=Streptomyces laurentii TaxID=39478 RepID=UPI00368BD7D7
MYFAALLARTEDGWEASDTELDDVETLADLAELAREAAADDGETVIVFIEQEDAWFGVVRVDGEDDPRVFVSNGAAAARSSYGEILTSEILGDGPDDALDELTDLDGTEDGEPEAADEDDEAADGAAAVAPPGPLGETLILADLGMDERALLGLETGDALGEIADAIGAADILEAVR